MKEIRSNLLIIHRSLGFSEPILSYDPASEREWISTMGHSLMISSDDTSNHFHACALSQKRSPPSLSTSITSYEIAVRGSEIDHYGR